MSHSATLTVAVPTYNRADCLSYLLEILEREVACIDGRVAVVVVDNASTDDTPKVIEGFKTRIPDARWMRNATNIGLDGNLVECWHAAETPYVWVLGDDDVPANGMLAALVNLLEAENPDLVRLPGRLTRDMRRDHPPMRLSRIRARVLDGREFAARVNADLTFISGLVVRKDRLIGQAVDERLRLTRGSQIPHMAWVMERLEHGEKFLLCIDRAMMATASDRREYSVSEVFYENLARIVVELGSGIPEIRDALLSRAAVSFYPLAARWQRDGQGDEPSLCLDQIELPLELTRTLAWRILVRPIWILPRPLAEGVYYLARGAKLAMLVWNHCMDITRRQVVADGKRDV